MAKSESSGAGSLPEAGESVGKGTLHAFVENAQRKLIDTSMRNRLLNFAGGPRSSAVEIVGEQPVAVWQALVEKKRRIVFRCGADAEGDAAKEEEEEEEESNDIVEEDGDGDENLLAEVESGRIVDAFETGLSKEVLLTKLRKLAETARTAMEEQGVSTLFVALGFLCFTEAKASAKTRRAPLLLVPAVLRRETAERWSVQASEDEPLVNPALVEYLQSQHDIRLPEMDAGEFDVASWYSKVDALVRSKPQWRLTRSCVASNFSFQKLVMHQDLKRNAEVVRTHPVVRQLALRTGTPEAASVLPREIRELELDRDFRSELTFQVVDADSTQQRALVAAARGLNLVIHGPPGTGKSQTITNLVSGFLAENKTVLFVAEKQAALNVVADRLKAAGLGDYCLELHSSKANKKVLLQSVGAAWEASLASVTTSNGSASLLPELREQLSAYARVLHQRRAPLEMTAFEAMGRLLQLRSAPSARVSLPLAGLSPSSLLRTKQLLATFASAASGLHGTPESHPWAGADLSDFSLERRERLLDALQELLPLVDALRADAPRLELEFGVVARDLSTHASLAELAQRLDGAPRVPRESVAGPEWESRHEHVASALDRAERVQRAEQMLADLLAPGLELEPFGQPAQLVLAKGRSIWAWFSAAWWRARKSLKVAIAQGRWIDAFSAAQTVAEALRTRAQRAALEADPVAASYLGALWGGASGDVKELRRVLEWTKAFRLLLGLLPARGDLASALPSGSPDLAFLRRFAADLSRAERLWLTIRAAGGWPPPSGELLLLDVVHEHVRTLHGARNRWTELQAFQRALAEVRVSPAQPLVEDFARIRGDWSRLDDAFERRVLELWLDGLELEEPSFGRFDGSVHSTRVEHFRELDADVVRTSQQRVVGRVRARTQEALKGAQAEKQLLRDQLARQRGHLPVRRLVHEGFAAIQAIKPCFLMSPMTVSQMVPIEQKFDVVIFDEASQLTAEDALGAVARGRQLIVVGDPKQLPPTNFFSVQLGEVDATTTEEGDLRFEDLESVLELAQAAGFHGTQLQWHYRSRHETLISYSNRNFYDSTLLTFPSTERDIDQFGLSFHFVEGATYVGKGVNPKEAEAVVRAVVEHVRREPHRSLGVGTFSLPQQQRINDLLERERRLSPELDAFMSKELKESFFVKNLENIQGDERDVIILSVTYGPGAGGGVRNNFGPLSGPAGWRRLNVLTTRARERMRVYSSMRADDISVHGDQKGAQLLRDFLRFAETKQTSEGPSVSARAAAESPFEREVVVALQERGVQIVPQVGQSGYRIDIGVVDEARPGRFLCGIECDGASYHSAQSARDRDRLREQVLRGLGWDIHRVWSTDWWRNPQREVERLLRLIEKSRARAERVASNESSSATQPFSPPPPPAAPPPAAPLPSRVLARPPLQVPVFQPYVVTNLEPQTGKLVDASPATLLRLCEQVASVETPVHEDHVAERLMAAFGQRRAGSAIMAKISETMERFVHPSRVLKQDHWLVVAGQRAVPRRRSKAARPELIHLGEFVVAVEEALWLNGQLDDEEIVGVVRDALGFSAATEAFRRSVASALETLDSRLLHGSAGYKIAQRG